ncbi:MAG: PspA-associated protein PspAB [Acidimicrobiales bacterium]
MPRIFDVILGRTKPVQANLDALFGLVGAVIQLQASESLVPSGEAGVCYKPAAGKPFAETAAEADSLLDLPGEDGAKTGLRQEGDQYGYHWVVPSSDDFQVLVNRVHLINSTLQDNGYGPQLLCSVFGFKPEGSGAGASAGAGAASAAVPTYLVYLYKRGSFYPFVALPGGGEKRDHESELRLQMVLANDLKIEQDKERWMPLWGLPVH